MLSTDPQCVHRPAICFGVDHSSSSPSTFCSTKHFQPHLVQYVVHSVDVAAILDADLHDDVEPACVRNRVARAREEVARRVDVESQGEDEGVDEAVSRLVVLVLADLGEQLAVNTCALVRLHVGHAALVDEAQEALGEGLVHLVELAFEA